MITKIILTLIMVFMGYQNKQFNNLLEITNLDSTIAGSINANS